MTISAKHYILDVWQCSDYVSGLLELPCCGSKSEHWKIDICQKCSPLFMKDHQQITFEFLNRSCLIISPLLLPISKFCQIFRQQQMLKLNSSIPLITTPPLLKYGAAFHLFFNHCSYLQNFFKIKTFPTQ